MAADPSRKNPIVFTPEQKEKVVNFWNSYSKANKGKPPDLVQIVENFSDGADKDPRSRIGRLVREILDKCEISAKTMKHVHVEEFVLTDPHKEFIRNNINTHSVYEVTKDLFWKKGEPRLQPLGREVRAVTDYLKEIGEYIVKKDEGTFPNAKYSPPATIHNILAKVNEYLHIGLTTQNKTAYQTKCLETTLQFLHSPRFLQEINNYSTQEKRIAFESEFIRSVYEKPDMSVDEVNLTINLCNDYIQAADIKKQLEKLNGVLDTITDDPEGRISMSLTEAIGKVTSSYNECVKRHQTLYSILNTTRSKRIQEKNSATANIVNIFEFFREEEGRRIFLKQAEILKNNRVSEVKKIQSLDDILLLALGMSEQEATI